MKKKSVSVILVIFVMVLLLTSFVSAGFLRDFFKKLFGIDDKADLEGQLRTLSPGGTNDYTSDDYCDCSDFGYECGTRTLCGKRVDCGNCIPGYSHCKNNKCVLLCEDSDVSINYPDGINYGQKGRVSDLTTSRIDDCIDEALVEYYCDVNDIKYVNHSCSEDGKICLDGACINEVPPPPGPCEPLTCIPDVDCGTKDDGCDGTIYCGICPPVFPDGLVAYWNLNDGAGATSFVDEIGGHDGTCSGASCPVYTTGFKGGAYNFDGNDDYISVSRSPELEPPEITVSVWINTNDLGGNYDHILVKPLSSNSASYALQYQPGNIYVFYINAGGEVASPGLSASLLEDGNWHHLAGTYDGNNVRLYFDGTEVGTGTPHTASISYSNLFDFQIAALDGAYNGAALIDDIMIFNRSLTLQEIGQLAGLECTVNSDCDDGNDCTINTCNPSSSSADGRGCVLEDESFGTSCNDGLFCKENEQCDGSGNCVGTTVGCSDSVACTDDSCTEGASSYVCINTPNDNNCNLGEMCDALLNCVADPCFGFTICGNYTSEAACISDSCNVPGICYWNSSLGVCEKFNPPSSCTMWVEVGGSGTDCSSANPCNLQTAINNAAADRGDVICLGDGYYGDIGSGGASLDNIQNTNYITIQSDVGHKAEFRSIIINNAAYWRFNNLEVSPELSPSYNPTFLFRVQGSTNHIILENSNLYYVKDSSNWNDDDWHTQTGQYAIQMWTGSDMIIRNNTLKNVRFGISLADTATNVLVEYNTIENIAADGITANIGNLIIQYNTLKNFYRVLNPWNHQYNHDDGIQNWANADNILIRGNTFIARDIGETSPLILGPMGINFSPGGQNHRNLTIENNVILNGGYAHGIYVDDAIDARIINNIAFDPTGTMSTDITLVRCDSHCVVRNNMARRITGSSATVTSDHNIDIDNYNWDVLFVDYTNHDVRHADGSPAIDAGSCVDAPTIDKEGVSRPQGSDCDVGAYEYVEEGETASIFSKAWDWIKDLFT